MEEPLSGLYHEEARPTVPVRVGSKRTSRRRISRQTTAALLAVPIVIFVYAFLGSAGFLSPWPTYNVWYDSLAEGFRTGHLHLSIDPPAELLSKPNPLAPENRNLWAWDCLLFGDKYYLYWGPVPAALQSGARALFRIRGLVGDQYLAFAFVSGCALFGALIITRILRRFYPQAPRPAVFLAVAAFAMANPLPYLAATPGTYQTAILGAQAFLLLGALLALLAVEARLEAETGWGLLAGAGASFGFALGCRFSVAPAIGLLVPMTAFASSARLERRVRRFWLDTATMATPITIATALLLIYNKARFNDWFEFGLKYQMETMGLSFSPRNLVGTLYSYFLRPSEISCTFPFVIQHWGAGLKPLPQWFAVPPNWVDEPIIGLLLSTPIVWMAPVPLLKTLGRLGRPTEALSSTERMQRVLKMWLATSLVTVAVTAGAAVLLMAAATMRYMADFASWWVLLGVWGSLSLVVGRPGLRRAIGRCIFAGVTLSTIVIGLLLGFQGYNNQFERSNRGLYQRAVEKLSLCSSR